jgi:hypothetical protein
MEIGVEMKGGFMVRIALLAMILMGCDLLDQAEEIVDPPPKVIKNDFVVPVDSVEADTLQ